VQMIDSSIVRVRQPADCIARINKTVTVR